MAEPYYITQPGLVDLARKLMGGIDLDPATSEHANALHRIHNAYGPGPVPVAWAPWTWGAVPTLGPSGGLSGPWFGRVWCNPPGGKDVRLWWDRAVSMWTAGAIEQCVYLGFNIEHLRTGAGVLRFPICIPRRRLEFINPRTHQVDKQARHANVVVWLPPLHQVQRSGCAVPQTIADRWSETFRSVFKEVGDVR